MSIRVGMAQMLGCIAFTLKKIACMNSIKIVLLNEKLAAKGHVA
jgi:hypothetical protein